MTVFVGNLTEAAVATEREKRYAFRYFAGGVELFKQFMVIAPETWAIHSFNAAHGMPAVLFTINNEG